MLVEIIAFTVICLVTHFVWLHAYNKLQEKHSEQMDKWGYERIAWAEERSQLLDRIQAPSFAEYTNKVVREKKAEQPQEEVKPVEFVS